MSLGASSSLPHWPLPDTRPPLDSANIVMGANAQVALKMFARYFEVVCRLVPIPVKSKYRLDPKKAMEFVDENTISVFVILGASVSCPVDGLCLLISTVLTLFFLRYLHWPL
jgi:hypothetical protein